jgi:hypothetical protein
MQQGQDKGTVVVHPPHRLTKNNRYVIYKQRAALKSAALSLVLMCFRGVDVLFCVVPWNYFARVENVVGVEREFYAPD